MAGSRATWSACLISSVALLALSLTGCERLNPGYCQQPRCGAGQYCDPVTNACLPTEAGVARDGPVDLSELGSPDGAQDRSADRRRRDQARDKPIAKDLAKDKPAAKDLRPSCAQLYGTAPVFDLCQEEADRCTFWTSVYPSSNDCVTVCAIAGGTCLAADVPSGYIDHAAKCTATGPSTCTAGSASHICVCSRS